MIRPAHSLFQLHSTVAHKHVAWLFAMLAVSVLLALPLAATVIVSTDINGGLLITPSSGVVVQTTWTAQAYAQAQNSLGQFDAHPDTSVGGVAEASATVAFADAEAEAMAPIPHENFAHSGINIPEVSAAASSLGRGTLFNTTFMITGGSGEVSTVFSVPLTTMQSLFTDGTGLQATSEVVCGVTLDGQLIVFRDTYLEIGPDTLLIVNFSGTLLATESLNFNQAYTIYYEVDSESSGINVIPEPPSGSLALLGTGFFLVRRFLMAVSTR